MIIVVVAGAIAYGISAAIGRGPAWGFYVVGAASFLVALSISGVTPGYVSATYYAYSGRRIGAAPAYLLVGALLVGIGVAIEVFTR